MLIKYLALACCIFFVGLIANAESVFVQVEGAAGVSEDSRATVAQLLRSSVGRTRGFEITTTRERADFVFNAQLLRLGEAYILSAEKVTSAGEVLFSERLRSSTMDNMDTVSDRLVEAVLFEKSAGETADITNVTKDEVDRNINRIKTIRQFYLGIGPGWGQNLDTRGGGFTWTTGHLWGLDPDYGVALQAIWNDGPQGDSSGYFDASLGVERYLTQSSSSPVFGAGIGYAHSVINDQCFILGCPANRRTNGWGAHVKLGYKFFRTSTVNLGLMGGYYHSFQTNRHGSPSMTSLQLVLYY